MDSNKRIKEIDKQILTISILDSPGAIMLGLGLYAKFGAEGDAFLPILNNQTFVNSLLLAGAVIMIWGSSKTFGLIRERARLEKGRR